MFREDMKWVWLLLAPVPAALVIRHLWRRRAWISRLDKKAVFITGCDSGFGYETAKSLYARGVHVYAGCFTESGANKLQQETGDKLRTVILDVTDTASIEKAYSEVQDTLPDGVELWGIVNNAGVAGHNGPLEFLKKEDFSKTLSVNFYGMVEMTRIFLPLLKKSRGRVVNTCSIISELPGPGCYPYCVSKWAARAFSESLSAEKAIWGIKVAIIQPGGFRTSLCTKESIIQINRERWDHLDQAIRDDYGEEYIQAHIDEIVKQWTNDQMFSPDLKPVVRAYEHALFAIQPRTIYYPGAEIVKYLPKWIICSFFMKELVPKCLKQK